MCDLGLSAVGRVGDFFGREGANLRCAPLPLVLRMCVFFHSFRVAPYNESPAGRVSKGRSGWAGVRSRRRPSRRRRLRVRPPPPRQSGGSGNRGRWFFSFLGLG